MIQDMNYSFVNARRAMIIVAILLSATANAQVTVKGSVYGGGNQAGVQVNTTVNISTGQVEGNVYGGGNLGDVGTHTQIENDNPGNYNWTANTGVCNVNISGGTIGTTTGALSPDHGNVFGGGKGVEDNISFWCLKGMVYSTNVSVSKGTVKGNVYGGGEVGRVESNTIVTIGPDSGDDEPEIKGSIFGAGKGLKTHGYSALVRGNPVVTIQGKAKVTGTLDDNNKLIEGTGNVYGGGEIASVGKHKVKTGDNTPPGAPASLPIGMPYTLDGTNVGICTVNVIGSAQIVGNVFGAGQGIEPENYSNARRMGMSDWETFASNDAYLVYVHTLALTTDTHVTIGGTRNTTTGTITASGAPTINGSVYGGSENGFVQFDSNVTIQAGTIGTTTTGGNVYGGGHGLATFDDAGLVSGNANVTVNGGSVGNNVYGGGELGPVKESVAVNITGGTVTHDVYGGGALANTNTANWNGSALVATAPYHVVSDLIPGTSVVTGLYTQSGSSAPYTYTEIATANTVADSETTYYRLADTKVSLTGGLIKGDAYGGGLGQKTGFNGATSDIAAVVYGDVSVNLGSSGGSTATAFQTNYFTNEDYTGVVKSGRIFGCNNLNGSPLGDVKVTVYKTVTGKNNEGNNLSRTDANALATNKTLRENYPDTYENQQGYVTPTYEVAAVYGGGNLANYTATAKTAYVRIETCDVSIRDVYGGGNAAEVPGTDVLVRGAYEIAEVFGGGNGNDPYTTDGGTTWVDNPGANVGNSTTPGNATTLLTGGYIHEAYGGSNKRGTIYGNVSIDMGTGSSANNTNGLCELKVEKLVGAGKDADVNGDLIMVLGCKPDVKTPVLYAGADNANVNGDVELTITSGKYGKVFGGNNMGGIIMGHIKLNIEETGDCAVPIEIDELYLGGNQAMYSQYGYYKDGNTYKPRTSENDEHTALTADVYGTEIRKTAPYAEPVLNVISCTYIGKVFGGGYGTGAALYGNPIVNINMIPGSHASNVHTKMAALTELNLPSTDNPNNLGIIGDVYGGGNAADVIGNPTVNIGTAEMVTLTSVDDDPTTTDVNEHTPTVMGAYIIGNVFGGGKGLDDTFFCEKGMIGIDGDGVDHPTGGTTVNIYKGTVRNNVYGGGEIGRVEKNTTITIGTEDGTANGTPSPVILGSVFGGGKGKETHGYAALVRGNPTVTIQGNATVGHSVYGGGEIASVARYNVPKTEADVEAAHNAGYTDAVLGMPYALADPDHPSGNCTVTVKGYAKIGPDGMQMTAANGPDDTGYVFGAGKGILPGGIYAFTQGTTRRMVLYDDKVHTNVGQTGSKWQWVDPDHSDTNKNVWEYFADLDEYIRFIQTLALSSYTDVTIDDNAQVKGSVYGGSENGIVQFDTDVKIQGDCQIGVAASGSAECASWTYVAPYAPYDPYAKYLFDGKYYYDENHTQYAEGGAAVATDGHTYYGNVFGGGSGSVPYFDTTLGQSVYLHSAGQVKGDTYVTISGGHILTNVYGGCEATNVSGTANVTMTAGTVGVERTDAQIIAHPLTGYIFGGGKGDQRIFFNKDTNVKDAVVRVEGGRIYGSVYGGGEDGHVLRNTTVTIGKASDHSGPTIGTQGTSYYDGHVFGGGRGFGGEALTAGNVGGAVTLTVEGGSILGSVYGGGRMASVGYGLYLTTETGYGEMRADNEYDGSYTNPSTEEAGTFFNKGRGHIIMNINGGTIGNDSEYGYDANNQLTHTKGGNVFAGGMGSMYKQDGSTAISSLDWWKLGNVKSTKLTISGTAEIKSNVYGGGELGMVQGGKHTTADGKTVSTEIIINGGTIGTEVKDVSNDVQYTFGSVFGGGYGSLTEKLDHTGSTNPTYSNYTFTYPKYIAGRVKGSTAVTISGSNTAVKASVYGGGEMAAVGESKDLADPGDSDPVVLGETLTGDNGAPIEANTYVTINDGIIGKSGFGGAKMGNVYGGGSGDNNTVRSGHVYGNTYVTIINGTIYHNVYGGGAYGTVGDFDYNTEEEQVTVNNQTVTVNKVKGIKGLKTSGTGVARVTITGGTIGVNGKENGMVFGSSRGDINQPRERDDYEAWVYDTHVTIGTSGSGTDTTTPLIKGSVYGSGENGHTYNNAEVKVHSGTIGIDDTNDQYYTVTSNDNEYSGAAYPYRGNVYGGGCGTDKYYENHNLETHDGNGQLYNPLAGIIYGNAIVDIDGGHVVRNVYGAGAMGSVGKTDADGTYISGGQTTVSIGGSAIIGVDGTAGDGNVFGAARGSSNDTSNDFALVYEKTSVSITGGTVNGNVYGGGELGYVGKFTSETNDVGSKTYTWPENTGFCEVTVNGANAHVKGHVFGAGKGSKDTYECEPAMVYKTDVYIYNGTVDHNVYGGGQLGRVENNATMTIGESNPSGTTAAPIITGDVFGAGAGVATHGYSALVRGNANVTVQGKASVGGNVYGGGETASVGRFVVNPATSLPTTPLQGGTCTVTVNGESAITGNVYGACKGVEPDFAHNEGHWTNDNQWHAFDTNDEAGYLAFLRTLALTSNTIVTIGGSATIGGSVFGGGQRGITLGDVAVNMTGGTVTNDVYGGGALADTNTGNWDATNNTWAEDKTSASYTTHVSLTGGIINGDAYGGGLGRLAATGVTAVEAYVYGDVKVELNKDLGDDDDNASNNTTDKGCVVNRIFGCNNLNGTPKGKVQVYVYATQKADEETIYDKAAKGTNIYDVKAVYGGGNLAPYIPADALLDYSVDANKARVEAARTEVYIDGCNLTSIETVYGGGNAASASGTFVEVNRCYEINEVFGGGNGADNYSLNGVWYQNSGANVGYYNYTHTVTSGTSPGSVASPYYLAEENTDADTPEERANSAYRYGSGIARTEIKGGRIHTVYGGSNKKGNISTTAVSMYSGMFSDCPMDVDQTYGGGKDAPIDGEVQVIMNCAKGVKRMFGGSMNSDVDADIVLTITNGSSLEKVFGGNNTSGAINGSITVNIEEGGCEPVIIGELYAGGYLAPYSIYGYQKSGDTYETESVAYVEDGVTKYQEQRIPLTSGSNPKSDPRINVISATRIDNIYGGGYQAKVVGNPHINVNMTNGSISAENIEDPSNFVGEHTLANGKTYTGIGIDNDSGDGILAIGTIGNIYGGGNMADIVGNTFVEIGTGTYHNAAGELEPIDPVRNAAQITGSVFGGGNQADVTVNTYVTMANGTVEGNIYGGGNLGDVGTHANQTPASTGNYDWKDQDGNDITANTATNKMTGICNVTITGGTIGPVGENATTDEYHGNVFGAGKGEKDTYECEKGMAYRTNVSIQDGTVKRNVYGGGQIGRVEEDVQVTIGVLNETGTPNAPVIDGSVYGAGAGVDTHGYSALVRGNSEVTVQGKARIKQNVYGGGETATVGRYWVSVVAEDPNDNAPSSMPPGMPYKTKSGGVCTVNVLGNAQIGPDGDASETAGHVFGAGKGVTPNFHYDSSDEIHSSGRMNNNGGWEPFTTEAKYLEFLQTLALVTNTYVTINGDASVTSVKGSVYGGSESGFVQDHTNVTIQNGKIGTETAGGNVFGGGRGLATFYEAGLVKGNTTVNVNGGNVGHNVYGGGELGNVGKLTVSSDYRNYMWTNDTNPNPDSYTYNNTGVCNVNISGGAIGATDVTMNADGTYANGNVFGAGKGLEDNFWCNKAIVYTTNVKVNDGIVNGNVYGGGEVGRVETNAEVKIGPDTGTSSPEVKGNVFGGGAGVKTHGYSALVRGNTYVTAQSKAKVGHNVYGGGQIAAVGKYYLVTADNVADHPGLSIGMPYSLVSDELGICNVTVIGEAEITGSVFGGGKGKEPENLDFAKPVNTEATNYHTTSYDIDAHMPKRMMNDYPGKNTYWEYSNPPTNTIIWEYFDTLDKYQTFLETLGLTTQSRVTIGGTRDGATITASGTPKVNGNVYGGSESGFVQHNTSVAIAGGTIGATTTTGDNVTVTGGNVFGGGLGLATFAEAGRVRGNTTVIVNNGTVNGNVYGGGQLGDVGTIVKSADYNYKWTDANPNAIVANNPETYPYNDTGLCTVTVNGGTIGTGVTANADGTYANGNVFGAGKGLEDTWWCEKAIAYKTNVTITDGTINGTIYGGGQVGRVETDAIVTIGTANETGTGSKPNITGNVFGAGAGLKTHGYSALVRGDATVTVQGIAQVGKSIYGGGEVASVGRFNVIGGLPKDPLTGGTCTVTIQDHAKIGAGGTGHNVFGACKGVTPSYDATNYKSVYSMQTYENRPSPADTPGDTWDYYYTYPEGYNGQKFIKRYYKTEDAYIDFLETLALTSHPIVTIAEDATVNGSVFGGGERGITLGRVKVNMNGGTVTEDVYGGGSLANTNKGNWDTDKYVAATVTTGETIVTGMFTRTGEDTTESPYVYTEIKSANTTAASGTTYYIKGAWADDTNTSTVYTTAVNLHSGTINRNVYGGGLGDANTAALVYGNVLVKLNETTASDNCVVKGNIFGCNNVNGTPKGDVTVHVYKTQGWTETQSGENDTQVTISHTKSVNKDNTTFDLAAVFGGGNQAAYDPEDAETREAHVIIDGCDLTSIQEVYGGGNAAAAPATHVEVNSCYEIGTVFGGGYGAGDNNPGADVGYKPGSPDKVSYGTGRALAELKGGTIHSAFGGSNKKGNVRTSATVDLNEPNPNDCPLCIGEVYGAGNNADQDGSSNINLGCLSYLSEIYGGAKNADVDNDIELTIQSGRFDRVFGGNNLGGNIGGSITVNIEETGCHPIIIGQLFGGGNQAAYTVPSGKHGPTVNAKSFTSIGEIYGGGYGASAIITGDTYVNINECLGDNASAEIAETATHTGWTHFDIDIVDKATGQVTETKTITLEQPTHDSGAIGSIGNVFGGGNEAPVHGSTNVNIGNIKYVEIKSIVVGETDIRGYYTLANGEYTVVSGESPVIAVTGTTYYKKVEGAKITGNVYGGGNAANVTGDTNVKIGTDL